MKKTLIAAAVTAATISSVSAANVILNSNFDDTVTVDTVNPAWGDTAAFASGITGWTTSGAGGGMASGDNFGLDTTPGAPYFAGNTGTQLLAASGSTFVTTTSNGTVTLSQSIGGLAAGSFDLSYDLGKISFAAGTLTARVEVFDGADNTATSLYNILTDVDALANTTWSNVSAAGIANSGSDLFVQITLIDSSINGQIAIDTISLDHTVTAVPEPSSTTLLGLGGLALILRRRK